MPLSDISEISDVGRSVGEGEIPLIDAGVDTLPIFTETMGEADVKDGEDSTSAEIPGMPLADGDALMAPPDPPKTSEVDSSIGDGEISRVDGDAMALPIPAEAVGVVSGEGDKFVSEELSGLSSGDEVLKGSFDPAVGPVGSPNDGDGDDLLDDGTNDSSTKFTEAVGVPKTGDVTTSSSDEPLGLSAKDGDGSTRPPETAGEPE